MNLTQLTYRQKNMLLLVGAALFLVIMYFASLKKTWDIWRQNVQLESKVAIARSAPVKIKVLQDQLESFEKVMKNYSGDTSLREEYLLNKLGKTCKSRNIILTSLPSPTVSVENDFEIESRFVKAKGKFLDLLLLVYEIENEYKVGRLSSVSFKIEEDRKNNASYLFAYIYIQNLKKKNVH